MAVETMVWSSAESRNTISRPANVMRRSASVNFCGSASSAAGDAFLSVMPASLPARHPVAACGSRACL
jgi:hypothetical protein